MHNKVQRANSLYISPWWYIADVGITQTAEHYIWLEDQADVARHLNTGLWWKTDTFIHVYTYIL